MKHSTIKFIIPYFGHWPEWINLFMQSCQYNPDINWLFFTDCGEPEFKAPNTHFIHIEFKDYKALVSKKLNINFEQSDPYKLCDLKPAYGYIHQEHIDGYDFFGFGDLDVIYGQLRHFLTEDILQNHQLISTHDNRISGHFCLLKNNETMRNAFRRMPYWKKLLETPAHLGIDESKFTKVFIPHRKHPNWLKAVYGLFSPYWRNNYFHEQYSTILSPLQWIDGAVDHPQEWQWEQGRLTNTIDKNREFMYLHFMNWKSSQWLHKQYGSSAEWENMETLVHFDSEVEASHWSITKSGFNLKKLNRPRNNYFEQDTAYDQNLCVEYMPTVLYTC